MPTLPTAMALSPAACSIDSVSPTVVVLPLVPVMVSQSAVLRPLRSRTRQASSTSPQTGMWARAAAASRAWSGPPARGGDDQVRLCTVDFGDGLHGVLAQQDVGGADDPQGVRLRLRRGAGGGVHDDHAGAKFDQRVGGGEAGDPDAGDDDPQSGPVGVPGDQVLEPG